MLYTHLFSEYYVNHTLQILFCYSAVSNMECRKVYVAEEGALYSTVKWQTSNPASTYSDRFNNSSSNHNTSVSCKIHSILVLKAALLNHDSFPIFNIISTYLNL